MMFGFFNLPSKAEMEAERHHLADRMARAVPWSPDVKWEKELQFQASTYKPRSLFDVEPLKSSSANAATPSQIEISPGGNFAYCEKVLPAGFQLNTYSGKRKGDVLFDGDVLIPSLHETRGPDAAPGKRWGRDPWMSHTPMEVLSLRPGTKKAKGNVIVAGLGLGYQLVDISLRKQVSSLTLVEESYELVSWIMPRLEPMLGQPVTVVIGSAYDVMPKLKADIAIVDIFPDYGGNWRGCGQLVRSCKSIKDFWCWGAA